MKALRIILLALAFIAFQAHADDERNLAVKQVNNAVSEQRIALVIGNGAYTSSPLKNPVNDAKDMAKKLRGLGFVVIERSNLQTKQIGATLREFRSKLVPGAVALVFYAGHGLQIKGDNYLPAVDADINSEEDVPNQSLAVKQIMDVLDESKTRLNLVFLDACRNNPYARSFRSADKGLARVSAPSGTLISYATRPGSVAADGGGRNGLYTSKLLAQMNSTVQIEQALKRVVTEVKAASQGKQEPWMEGSIEGDFCFAGCNVPAQGATAQPAVVDPAALELDAWNTAREMNTEDAYQAYLADHADGRHAKFAQAAINKLKAVQQPAQIAMHAPGAMQSEVEAAMKPGKVFRDCPDCPEMVILPKSFAMGKYEVTQGQWKALMGNNPSHFSSCGDSCPVEQVSWNDAQAFIQKLNAKTGKQYRLPTEAEWEYACYGGIQSEYCGGNNFDAVGWNNDNCNRQIHPVGQKQANGYGLYDMSGNVWEWAQDLYDSKHDWRVLRGGSCFIYAKYSRAAVRYDHDPGDRSLGIGFRVARVLP
ncbi:MAG: SUMF1/EgtB/PvdO family nonheme iron enzyme [Gallionella sp.]|nr:SUMF1/EgtB/PvdO family nonheme iron enzyme [Gallionella sp.]